MISFTKCEYLYKSYDDFYFLISLYNKILNIMKTFPSKEILNTQYEKEIELAVSKLSSIKNLSNAEIVMNRYINFHTEIIDKGKNENSIAKEENSIDESSIMFDGVAMRKKEIESALNDPSKLIQFYKELEKDSKLIELMMEKKRKLSFSEHF